MTSLRVFTLWFSYFSYWTLGTGAALSAGAADSATAATAARPKIVILGDSLTAGFGLGDPAQAYPALLQKKIDDAGLRYEVVNAGVSGDTTAGGLRRVDWALARGAAVLVVALGGNDGLRGVPTEQTEANLVGIINKARAKQPNVQVLLAGMQMPPTMGATFTENFRSLFPRVALKNHAALVPFLLQGVGGIAKLNQPDMIHPTSEGQQIVAETVWKELRPLLGPAAN